MLSPPVPIPIASYLLAYHLKSQDASPAPSALRAFMARNRQISNGRLYLPLLYFRCNCFRVFTNVRHRAHAGATFLFLFLIRFFTAPKKKGRASFTAMPRAARGAEGADYKKCRAAHRLKRIPHGARRIATPQMSHQAPRRNCAVSRLTSHRLMSVTTNALPGPPPQSASYFKLHMTSAIRFLHAKFSPDAFFQLFHVGNNAD